jgi:hypothetical protein
MSHSGRIVDIQRRTEYVGQRREDRTEQGCVIIGQTEDHSAATSDAVWQIWRVTNEAGVIVTQYADYGKYSQIWDDRATLFAACPPGADPLPGDTNTNVVKAPPTIKWIELTAINTEESYTLPVNTKRFEVVNRSTVATIRFAYEVGKADEEAVVTDNEYWPLDPLTTYGEEELTGPIALYFETPSIAGPGGVFIVVKSWQQ